MDSARTQNESNNETLVLIYSETQPLVEAHLCLFIFMLINFGFTLVVFYTL